MITKQFKPKQDPPRTANDKANNQPFRIYNKTTIPKYDVSPSGIYVNQNYYGDEASIEERRKLEIENTKKQINQFDNKTTQLVHNLQQQVYFLELELEHLRNKQATENAQLGCGIGRGEGSGPQSLDIELKRFKDIFDKNEGNYKMQIDQLITNKTFLMKQLNDEKAKSQLYSQKLASTEQQLNDTSNQLKVVEKNYFIQLEQNNQLYADIKNLDTRWKSEYSLLNEKYVQSQANLMTVTKQIDELKSANDVLTTRVSELESEIHELTTKNNQLSHDLEDNCSCFNIENKILNENQNKLESDLQHFMNLNNDLNISNDKFKSENELLTNKIATLLDTSNSNSLLINNLTKDNKILQEQLNEINNNYKKIHIENDNMKIYINRIDETNKDIKEKNRTYLNNEYKNIQTINELESKLHIIIQRNNELERTISLYGCNDDNLRKENIELKGHLRQLLKTIEIDDSDLKNKKEKEIYLEKQINELIFTNKTLNEELDKFKGLSELKLTEFQLLKHSNVKAANTLQDFMKVLDNDVQQ